MFLEFVINTWGSSNLEENESVTSFASIQLLALVLCECVNEGRPVCNWFCGSLCLCWCNLLPIPCSSASQSGILECLKLRSFADILVPKGCLATNM
jgi:hypothetical protein